MRNRSYSPADLLAISMALQQLNAKRSSIFIAKAADARSADEGAFQTQRAVAIARNSAILGGIRSFVDVGGFPLNLDRERPPRRGISCWMSSPGPTASRAW